MALLYYYFFSSFLTFATSATHLQALHSQDLHSLLSFKASADPHSFALHTWEGLNPCSGSWAGVECNRGRIVSINLDNASLMGSVDPILRLTQLQILSLRRNTLTGPLPHLSNLTNPRLRHLYLSQNQLNGTLSISLPSLLSLRIEENGFSGALVGLQLPNSCDLNVSENHLSGEIPATLSKFGISAFGRNPDLCGVPLQPCVRMAQTIRTAAISPSPISSHSRNCTRVALTTLGLTQILAIGIGDTLVILVALVLLVGMYLWLTKKRAILVHKQNRIQQLELDRGCYEKGSGLVCFQGGEDLSLQHLLKSSAEVLGKGMVWSTYKAVLDNGQEFVVKRLNAERFQSIGKAFDQQMLQVGRLRHCNVVSMRAYCTADQEKLLVYDYIAGGSLHSLLYRNSQGSLRARILDWRTRKQILMGAANGLNYIHTFPGRLPLLHGNIKPSNILIDERGNALISECGIMRFANSIHQANLNCHCDFFSCATNCRDAYSWHGSRAPELFAGKGKATQETDIYNFGMVLLEVVTDKHMEDAECEGEMMEMVKIGMMCTKESPDERPKMSQVVSMISKML